MRSSACLPDCESLAGGEAFTIAANSGWKFTPLRLFNVLLYGGEVALATPSTGVPLL